MKNEKCIGCESGDELANGKHYRKDDGLMSGTCSAEDQGAAVRGEAVAEGASSIQHDSDCSLHNMPAYPAGPCDCTAKKVKPDFATDEEWSLMGLPAEGSQNGIDWFAGELVEIIDLFAPYRVRTDSGKALFQMIRPVISVSPRAADAPSEPSELPQFPWNPDPINHEWTQREIEVIRAYGQACCDAGAKSRAADALDSQPTDDEPTEREALIACLGDDAVTLLRANPDDEMAQTMREAAAMLESDGELLASQPAASASQESIGSDAGFVKLLMGIRGDYFLEHDFPKVFAYVDQWASRRAPAAQAASVLDGWKLVPIKPTLEMLSEADEDKGATITDPRLFAGQLYRAMLKAAPAPQRGGQ